MPFRLFLNLKLDLAHDAVNFAREKQVALFSSSGNHDDEIHTRQDTETSNFCLNSTNSVGLVKM